MTDILLWVILVLMLCGPVVIIRVIHDQSKEREMIDMYFQGRFDAIDANLKKGFNALSVQARGEGE